MPRFTAGARVRVAEEKTTDRVGTVIEVLPQSQRPGDYDHYRVEFPDGSREILSDLQLSPAGSTATVRFHLLPWIRSRGGCDAAG